jgi:hypothetical protein
MKMHLRKHSLRSLILDVFLISLSIAASLLLARSGIIGGLVGVADEYVIIASFLAGLFFTSFFTTAPAVVALGQIALNNNLAIVSVFGALGAVCGDAIIFRFIRDHFVEHARAAFFRSKKPGKRLSHLLSLRFTRWVLFLFAGFLIASPLPDELGIGILNFAKYDFSSFAIFSFLANGVGILLVGIIARQVA